MDAESAARGIHLLTQVLNGKSYEAIAREARVGRTAVEKRVKAVARELGLSMADGAASGPVRATDLRRNRDAWLDVIARWLPGEHPPVESAALNDKSIDQLLLVTRATSRWSARDIALVFMLFATGAKPLEIARLEVRDYLDASGAVRVESVMRAEAAINSSARPLHFANPKLVAALDAYLRERAGMGYGTGDPVSYRGLAPKSRLFLTAEGAPMAVITRMHGGRVHHRCPSILEIYRRLFRLAGPPGMNASSARRVFVRRLVAHGRDVAEIGHLLGISARAVRKLLVTPEQSLHTVLSELL